MNALIRWFEIVKSKWFSQAQAGFAKIAIDAGPNEWNALAAQTDELTDQNLIRKIALEAKGAPIRRAVIHKLMDQSLVAKIALEDASDIVAEAAVAVLKDQEKIVEVAIKRPVTCRVALDKLTEQRWIEKLALEATEPLARKYAFWKLKNPSPELMARYGSQQPTQESLPLGQINHANLGSILSQYHDLPGEEKEAIQAQLKQCAEKDPNFWKAVVDLLKKDPMADISDRIAILDAIDPAGKMEKEIGDRYYSA